MSAAVQVSIIIHTFLHHACSKTQVTRLQDEPPPQYWQEVADRVALSQEQVLQCSYALEQFSRMHAVADSQCRQWSLEANLAGLQLADMVSSCGKSWSPHASQEVVTKPSDLPSSSAIMGASATATATSPAESDVVLDSRLSRHLHGMPLPGLLLFMFGGDTLTDVQMATMNVASFPYVAAPGVVPLAAAKNLPSLLRQRVGLLMTD